MIRTPLQQFQNTWPAGKGAFDVSGEFVYSGVANILGVSSVSELGQPPHTLSLEGGGGDTQLLLDPSDSQSQTEHVWIGPPPQTPAHQTPPTTTTAVWDPRGRLPSYIELRVLSGDRG